MKLPISDGFVSLYGNSHPWENLQITASSFHGNRISQQSIISLKVCISQHSVISRKVVRSQHSVISRKVCRSQHGAISILHCYSLHTHFTHPTQSSLFSFFGFNFFFVNLFFFRTFFFEKTQNRRQTHKLIAPYREN